MFICSVVDFLLNVVLLMVSGHPTLYSLSVSVAGLDCWLRWTRTSTLSCLAKTVMSGASMLVSVHTTMSRLYVVHFISVRLLLHPFSALTRLADKQGIQPVKYQRFFFGSPSRDQRNLEWSPDKQATNTLHFTGHFSRWTWVSRLPPLFSFSISC